jgi:hypothetical protein
MNHDTRIPPVCLALVSTIHQVHMRAGAAGGAL